MQAMLIICSLPPGGGGHFCLARCSFGPPSHALVVIAIDEWYRLYNRWMVSFVDTICYVSKIMTIKRNLMILDNSGIDYSRMLLFVLGFLVYWKIEPNSHAFSRIWQHVVYDLISKQSNLNCQNNKMQHHRKQFLRFYYNK